MECHDHQSNASNWENLTMNAFEPGQNVIVKQSHVDCNSTRELKSIDVTYCGTIKKIVDSKWYLVDTTLKCINDVCEECTDGIMIATIFDTGPIQHIFGDTECTICNPQLYTFDPR